MRKNSFFLMIVALVLFVFIPMTFAQSVKLAWNAPTTNRDGTPLTDLAGFKLYRGTSSGSYPIVIDVGNVTTYTLTGLTVGATYYMVATAYDSTNNESPFSNEINFTVQAVPDTMAPATFTMTCEVRAFKEGDTYRIVSDDCTITQDPLP